jgi:hypothetical protein
MYRAVLLLSLVCGSTAFAAPVLNKNAPGAVEITAYPDSVDPDLFYVAPTVMLVAHDEHGVPLFSYLEEDHAFTKKAVVQATMVPSYNETDLAKAEGLIKANHPNAKFTALPFVNSSVRFGDVLSAFVEENDCNHAAGVVGQEETCTFRLNNRGRHVMRNTFRQGLTITLQLQYSIEGVVVNVDGRTYTPQTATFEMAGRLGGAELAKYPELFRDSDGKPIGVDGGDDDDSI